MKAVAVLGCGPAGLMAAHAVAFVGRPVAVFSIPEKSVLGGAQFLHKPIPVVCEDDPDITVTFQVEGDANTYRRKVYGPEQPIGSPGFVSFSNVHDGMTQPAWNLQVTYDKLWDIFGNEVNPQPIDAEWLDKVKDDFDLILSTIPLPRICLSAAGLVPVQHRFFTQEIGVVNESVYPLPDNTVFYDGTQDHSFYRCSKLFGHGSTEWSPNYRMPQRQDIKVFNKPITALCDCWQDRIVRLGRFGAWKKGLLTHDAFAGALQACKEKGWMA